MQKISVIALSVFALVLAAAGFGGVMSSHSKNQDEPASSQKAQKTEKRTSPRVIQKAPKKRIPSSQPTSTKKPSKGKLPSEVAKDDGKDSDCDTGCTSKDKDDGTYTLEKYHSLLAKYAKEPLKDGSKALEYMLFYGKKTKSYLKKYPPKDLNKGHLSFLEKQLSRSKAYISLRLVDEKGVIRASFTRKMAEVGGHFSVKADKIERVQRPSFSGKVKRVGLHHIWVRI